MTFFFEDRAGYDAAFRAAYSMKLLATTDPANHAITPLPDQSYTAADFSDLLDWESIPYRMQAG